VAKVQGTPNAMPDCTGPVFFAGAAGSGAPTTDDWIKTLSALETEDVQVIATHVTSKDILTLISNHCTLMSNVQNRKERRAFLGGSDDETVDDALDFAKQLDNKLVVYCYPAITALSPFTGRAEGLSAAYFGCKMLGLRCALAINEPLTWKNVRVLGFKRKLKITEMEKLIAGGVLCGGETDDKRLAVIRAVTTYQGRQLQLAEESMVWLDLFMNRDLRTRLSAGVGRPGLDGGSGAEQTLLDAARDWRGQGYIVPTDSGESVWGVVVRKDGDKTFISFNRNIVAPQNFFFITAYNYVYSSATTVAA
jgi:phage tail sheath gpL-like